MTQTVNVPCERCGLVHEFKNNSWAAADGHPYYRGNTGEFFAEVVTQVASSLYDIRAALDEGDIEEAQSQIEVLVQELPEVVTA